MKAPEILRRLVRRFGLLLLLTLVGGIAGAAYSALKTPTYTAKAYVVAVSTGAQSDPIAALNFAQAYGRVATSDPVLAKAGVLLGADRSGLREATSSTSPDAPVIELTATGSDPAHTAAVANSLGAALVEYGDNRKADTKVGLSLLAGAMTPSRPSSPRPPMELAVGAAGGLLIGGLAVLAGVGRPAAAEERAEPVDDDVDETPGPIPAQRYQMADMEAIEQFPDEEPPKAITSYRATATPAYLMSDEDDPVPLQRAYGRAVVAQEDEDK